MLDVYVGGADQPYSTREVISYTVTIFLVKEQFGLVLFFIFWDFSSFLIFFCF